MHSNQELQSLLTLNAVMMGLTRQVYPLLRQGMPPSRILQKIERDNFLNRADKLRKKRKDFSAARELENCCRLQIEIISYFDPRYPRLLREIPDPPLLLYAKGDPACLNSLGVAVVGSRNASLYGITQAKKFSSVLAENGVTILSGLARGIDQAAHEAALTVASGRTLAVTGSGLDIIYPVQNRNLFEKIIRHGLVISEYPLGTLPRSINFPRRNRIISGLGLALLVVEAHQRSGSLITAREALEQGREVFALPGPVDVLTSLGTNRLIQEGAALVMHPDEILQTLAGMSAHWQERADSKENEYANLRQFSFELEQASQPEPQPASEPGDEVHDFLKKLLKEGALPFHEILNQGRNHGSARLSLALTRMEVNRAIRKTRDGRFEILVP